MIYRSILGPVYDLGVNFGRYAYDPHVIFGGLCTICRSILGYVNDLQVNGHNPRANFVGSVYDQQIILWGLHTFYAGEMGDQTGPASARRRACYPLPPA